MSEPEDMGLEEFVHRMSPQLKASIAFLLGLLGTIITTWILGIPLADLMKSIQDTFLYHFIPFIISFSFFIVLIYKAYVKDIKGLGFISSAVLLHAIAEFLAMISNPTGSIFNRGDNLLAAIADLMFPSAVILIYLHVELTDKIRPNLVHAIGIMATSLPIIIGGVALIILGPIPFLEELKNGVQTVIMVYLGLFALIILWISLFGLKIMYKNLKHADSPSIALASSLMLVGFSSLLTNFVLMGAEYSYILLDRPIFFQGETIDVHSTWLLTFSLICMLGAYVWVPKFAYSVPFDVYQILVLNANEGVTLYSFTNEVREVRGKQTHDALKSPAIMAIRNLVKEIASAKGEILLLQLDDRIIKMKSHHEIVSVLIAEKNAYFLNQGLVEFTRAFYEEFEDNIKHFDGYLGAFEDANKLIQKYFPFMREETLHI